MSKCFVLCPGQVISANDGQSHYVGPMLLARLYRVSVDDCEIYEPAGWWPPSHYVYAKKANRGLIRLTPRSDGIYDVTKQPREPRE